MLYGKIVNNFLYGVEMEVENLKELTMFLDKCEKELFDDKSKIIVDYSIENIDLWKTEDLKQRNKKLLKDLSNNANVYSIFIAEKDSEKYNIAYIGQTKSEYARTRLTNHLIKKHDKTGAKLKIVKKLIKSGGRIKISWISIKPMSLRHYVEEELIKKYKDKLLWNQNK